MMAYTIGICGVRGAGKSTIARNLGLIIRADIISSGRTRDIIRAQYTLQASQELFQSVTNANSIIDALHILSVQAEILKHSLLAVIEHCSKRDANLILEGTHILPDMFINELDLNILLTAPKKVLARRIYKDKNRNVSENMIKLNFELQEQLIDQAKKNNISIIDTTSIPSAIIEIIKLLPSKAIYTNFE